MEQEKVKICQNRKCLFAGVPQTLENFKFRLDTKKYRNIYK